MSMVVVVSVAAVFCVMPSQPPSGMRSPSSGGWVTAMLTPPMMKSNRGEVPPIVRPSTTKVAYCAQVGGAIALVTAVLFAVWFRIAIVSSSVYRGCVNAIWVMAANVSLSSPALSQADLLGYFWRAVLDGVVATGRLVVHLHNSEVVRCYCSDYPGCQGLSLAPGIAGHALDEFGRDAHEGPRLLVGGHEPEEHGGHPLLRRAPDDGMVRLHVIQHRVREVVGDLGLCLALLHAEAGALVEGDEPDRPVRIHARAVTLQGHVAEPAAGVHFDDLLPRVGAGDIDAPDDGWLVHPTFEMLMLSRASSRSRAAWSALYGSLGIVSSIPRRSAAMRRAWRSEQYFPNLVSTRWG